MVMPPEVPLLYKIVLAILGFLFFHIKLIIVLSRSVKKFDGILMGIELNLSWKNKEEEEEEEEAAAAAEEEEVEE